MVPILEPAAMREVMSRFATGVIVLSVGGDHIHGMTANAFSSVSLDPPLLLCCVAHSAVMHRALLAERNFAVSIMGADQEDQARYFADKERPLGPAQFDAVDWRPGPHTGAPLLKGALGWLECELSESYDAGDHSVFVGRVLSSTPGPGRDGLLFFDGQFRRTAP
ncbi:MULTISPECIES: flavin reductase family protein [unclassified Streptomyces]|uniref:flavin reductase family protein n=1 Tax=unclassified Streptomyces TaxID=2593676 RepID=UPI003803214D